MGNEQDNIVKLYREGGWLDQLDEYIRGQIDNVRSGKRFDVIVAHVYGIIIGSALTMLGVAFDHPELLQRH